MIVCDSLNLKFGDDVKRISKAGPTGRESSVFSKSQASQLRSQQSQQSFSQGVSSQHGMFSQLSLNSLDETLTNDQVNSLSQTFSVFICAF